MSRSPLPTRDGMIVCDATRVSPSQFLDALLGREPKSAEQKARELAEWQEQTRRECAEYRAGMDARAAAMFEPTGLTPSVDELSDPLLKRSAA